MNDKHPDRAGSVGPGPARAEGPAPASPPVSPPVSPPAAGAEASQALAARLSTEIGQAGGWMGFEHFMERALYAPGLGYYARGAQVFGMLPSDGSDFITAPELSPLFGRALARQIAQALQATGCDELWEFGAGSGALAAQLLAELGPALRRYTIVDLSAALQARQQATVQERVPEHAGKLAFARELPEAIEGVVVGNELLDAMPVALLHFDGAQWFERGVALAATVNAPADAAGGLAPPLADRERPHFVWADRPTGLRPPHPGPFVPGTVTELARQAPAFVATLARHLRRGAAFFIDYGFPEAEYYHPQRHTGTLMCHRAHRADTDPLADVGLKDITAHVDFTAIALAGQDAGLQVLGYTSQSHFLMNCGLAADLAAAPLPQRVAAQRLVLEHEMGELFKVIGFATGDGFDALGFTAGDRSHRL